ncbi:hypothetical protein IGI04_042925 [Brassica rapa subsp. trilocularis]|uniref:Uncharacterized protein n=1 Tax=Brassica rapa subsp. trilocularis TaxID=1813537 RepID=A0ABQ7KKK8_BRACM|nr:hypothetical protein IGI04_042925 [Brassica rapa subsp. trilocularis]
MMKDEEAMSKAASSVEVIGEWLKHPHVAQATRWRLYKKKKQPRLSKRSCISKKRLIWCVRALQPNKRLGNDGNGKSLVAYTGASSSRSNDDYIKRSDLDALFKMLKENGNTYGYSFGASMIAYKDDHLIRELVEQLEARNEGGWRGVMNLKPKLLVQELITSGYKKDEAKRSRFEIAFGGLRNQPGSQEVFLVHHPSELKEEDFAHCVEQWRVEKEVVMRHWCEVSLKLTCKLGPILNPSLRRGV